MSISRSKLRWPAFAAAAGLLAAFVALGLMQHAGLLRGVDLGVYAGVREGRLTAAAYATPAMLAATWLGDWQRRVAAALVCMFALLYRRDRRAAATLAVAVGGAMLVSSGAKLLFAAARPDILEPLDAVSSYSYPSGHALNSAVLAASVALVIGRRWAWWPAALYVLAVGMSRVWLGVHWPSDVIGGWLLAAAWLSLLAALGVQPGRHPSLAKAAVSA